jgi:hypothetical protein
MNSFNRDNYSDLKELEDYIKSNNVLVDFNILAIHTNKTYLDQTNFINFTMNVEDKHMSLNMETHIPSTFNPYRKTIKEGLKEILQFVS